MRAASLRPQKCRLNMRMKLSPRGGRLKGNGSILIAAAAQGAAYARFVRQTIVRLQK
jgi:hypothetical protein